MLNDRATLDAFRRGDPQVLTQVYRAYLPVVARLARSGFSFQSKGEPHRFRGYELDYEQLELVQETFVRAFSDRARDSYNGITPYEHYLIGIAKNLVIDHFRSRAARMRLFEVTRQQSAQDEAPSQVDPEAALDRERLRRTVRAFIEELPNPERRFTKLRFGEGLSQEQVAQTMKINRNRVRTLERRVRLGLNRVLQVEGWVAEGAPRAALASLLAVVA